MTRNITRGAVLALTIGFTLGCGGLSAAFDQGLEDSARDAIKEARAAVAKCSDGKPKKKMERALDKVQKGLDSGEMGGMDAAFSAGVVLGAAEDGQCTPSDLEEIKAIKPALLE